MQKSTTFNTKNVLHLHFFFFFWGKTCKYLLHAFYIFFALCPTRMTYSFEQNVAQPYTTTINRKKSEDALQSIYYIY
jgi:hypothetical protein